MSVIKKSSKQILICFFYLLLWNMFSEEILKLDFNELSGCGKYSVEVLEELAERSNETLVDLDNTQAGCVYSAKQMSYLIEKNKDLILKLYNFKEYTCYYAPYQEKIINGVKLTKAFLFFSDKEHYYPGVCVYMNLDQKFREKHTYLFHNYYSTVFDEDGKTFLAYENKNSIKLYKLDSVFIEYGALFDGDGEDKIIFIDKDTKQLKCFYIEEGVSKVIKNLPPFNKPELFYGMDLEDPKYKTEYNFNKLSQCKTASLRGSVNLVSLRTKDENGTVYNLDTLYLIDYDFYGNRKKGVYKITGDTFQFYPEY